MECSLHVSFYIYLLCQSTEPCYSHEELMCPLQTRLKFDCMCSWISGEAPSWFTDSSCSLSSETISWYEADCPHCLTCFPFPSHTDQFRLQPFCSCIVLLHIGQSVQIVFLLVSKPWVCYALRLPTEIVQITSDLWELCIK